MKTLSFDTVEKYEILYESLCVPVDGYRGREVVLASRMLDKFESIGKKKVGEKEKGWTLINAPSDGTYPTLELEDEDFNLLLRVFDAVPWNTVGARTAAKVYDWLHSIK